MIEHRLHPFAALRVLRKTLVLYLVPLLRVLFERNWAALRAALRQDPHPLSAGLCAELGHPPREQLVFG